MILNHNSISAVQAALREIKTSSDPKARRQAASLSNQLGRIRDGGQFNHLFYRVLDLYEDVRRSK